MSRTIKNNGLAHLCQAFDLRIADLDCILKCNRYAIRLYAIGRKHFPRIESGLARVFDLTVPELRKILFTRKGAKYAALHFKVRRRRLIPIWRKDSNCEKFLNGGEKYADYPIIRERIEFARQRGNGEIRINKLPINGIRAELWSL